MGIETQVLRAWIFCSEVPQYTSTQLLIACNEGLQYLLYVHKGQNTESCPQKREEIVVQLAQALGCATKIFTVINTQLETVP